MDQELKNLMEAAIEKKKLMLETAGSEFDRITHEINNLEEFLKMFQEMGTAFETEGMDLPELVKQIIGLEPGERITFTETTEINKIQGS